MGMAPRKGAWLMLTIGLLMLNAIGDDLIKKKDGSTVSGQITGLSNGQVFITSHAPNGSLVKLPYYLSDIASVTMAPPPEMAKADGATPAATAAILEPLVKQYAGLPANWVIDAMAQLASAYGDENQPAKAEAIYQQINQLYPNSPFLIQAVAGRAKMSLAEGKVDDAITAIQPVITKANQDLAPSPEDGRFYANAFLVYGQALEAKNDLPGALEAYLTVKTMFYQNQTLVTQADQLAGQLRQKNPTLGVN